MNSSSQGVPVQEPIKVFPRARGKDGLPVPFKLPRVTRKKKAKAALLPGHDEAWAYLGKNESELMGLKDCLKTACNTFPFVIRWTSFEPKTGPFELLVSGSEYSGRYFKVVPLKDEGQAIQRQLQDIANNCGNREIQRVPDWGCFVIDSEREHAAQILYQETLAVRGNTEDTIARVMQAKPVPEAAPVVAAEPEEKQPRHGEWKKLSQCYEEAGSRLPFVVEWNQGDKIDLVENIKQTFFLIEPTTAVGDPAWWAHEKGNGVDWRVHTHGGASCHYENGYGDFPNYRVLYAETEVARNKVEAGQSLKPEEAAIPKNIWFSSEIEVNLNMAPS